MPVNGMNRTECMKIMAGKVDDTGAFCMWAEQNEKGPFAANHDAATLEKTVVEFKTFAAQGLETRDLDGIEVFATGKHNGDTYTVADLDEMVKAHAAIGHEIKPFVKLGHDKKQALVQNDGWPAAGWIQNVRRTGNVLVADFKKVPAKVAALMQAGGLRRVSSEIFLDWKQNGTTYPYVLKAVALLGDTMPEVRTLNDVVALYGSNEMVKAYAVDETTGATIRVYEREDDHMTDAERKELDDARARVREFEAKEETRKAEHAKALEDAKAASDAAAAQAKKDAADATKKFETAEQARVLAEAKLADAAKATLRAEVDAEVTALLNKAVAGGRLAPRSVALFKAVAMGDVIAADAKGVREFSYKEGEGDKAKDVTITWANGRELVKLLVESMPKIVDFSTSSEHREVKHEEGETEQERTYASVGNRAKEIMAEEAKAGRKITLAEAGKRASRELAGRK